MLNKNQVIAGALALAMVTPVAVAGVGVDTVEASTGLVGDTKPAKAITVSELSKGSGNVGFYGINQRGVVASNGGQAIFINGTKYTAFDMSVLENYDGTAKMFITGGGLIMYDTGKGIKWGTLTNGKVLLDKGKVNLGTFDKSTRTFKNTKGKATKLKPSVVLGNSKGKVTHYVSSEGTLRELNNHKAIGISQANSVAGSYFGETPERGVGDGLVIRAKSGIAKESAKVNKAVGQPVYTVKLNALAKGSAKTLRVSVIGTDYVKDIKLVDGKAVEIKFPAKYFAEKNNPRTETVIDFALYDGGKKLRGHQVSYLNKVQGMDFSKGDAPVVEDKEQKPDEVKKPESNVEGNQPSGDRPTSNNGDGSGEKPKGDGTPSTSTDGGGAGGSDERKPTATGTIDGELDPLLDPNQKVDYSQIKPGKTKDGRVQDKFGNKLDNRGDIYNYKDNRIAREALGLNPDTGFFEDENGFIYDKNGGRLDTEKGELYRSGKTVIADGIKGIDDEGNPYDEDGNIYDKYGNKLDKKTGNIYDNDGDIAGKGGVTINLDGEIVDKDGNPITLSKKRDVVTEDEDENANKTAGEIKIEEQKEKRLSPVMMLSSIGAGIVVGIGGYFGIGKYFSRKREMEKVMREIEETEKSEDDK